MNRIKLVYINLDRRPDRREVVEKQFDKQGVSVNRFSGIDGKNIVVDQDLEKMFEGNNFQYRRGVVGAALSHTTLWRELATSDDYDYYLIFEDDINLHAKFKEHLGTLEGLLENNNPDFVFLGYHTDKHYMRNPSLFGIMRRGFYLYKMPTTEHVWGGLFSYLISKEFAKKMVKLIDKEGIKEPIDTFILKKTQPFCSQPILVNSPFMTFHNGVDSDIQYDMLGIHDDYDFYPEMDSPGNDIRWSTSKKFINLKAEADADENCVGFNTYAFLKSKVTTPDKFVKLPGCNSILHGLYVKRNHPNNQEYRDYLSSKLPRL